MEQSFGVVIVAAGRGTRMGTKERKQYLQIWDKPVIVHTIERFQAIPECATIVWVTSAQDLPRCENWVLQYGLDKVRDIIVGGKERQHSVYAGLQALQAHGFEYVLIHDGVRPLVNSGKVKTCFSAAQQHGAAVLAVPMKDTIKQVNGDGVITITPDRHSLWAIQTPQAFRLSVCIAAHERAEREGFIGTDDAMLVERIGVPVHVVTGDYMNIKLTTPEDLDWASWWMSQKE